MSNCMIVWAVCGSALLEVEVILAGISNLYVHLCTVTCGDVLGPGLAEERRLSCVTSML